MLPLSATSEKVQQANRTEVKKGVSDCCLEYCGCILDGIFECSIMGTIVSRGKRRGSRHKAIIQIKTLPSRTPEMPTHQIFNGRIIARIQRAEELAASALELCVDALASLTLVTLIIVSNEVVAVPSLALTVME